MCCDWSEDFVFKNNVSRLLFVITGDALFLINLILLPVNKDVYYSTVQYTDYENQGHSDWGDIKNDYFTPGYCTNAFHCVLLSIMIVK